MQNAGLGQFQFDGIRFKPGLVQGAYHHVLQFLAIEVYGRDVDGHADALLVQLLPPAGLVAGFLYDPFADRHDQAEFLCDGNEYLG